VRRLLPVANDVELFFIRKRPEKDPPLTRTILRYPYDPRVRKLVPDAPYHIVFVATPAYSSFQPAFGLLVN
jgi:hypothetical protein